MASDGLLTSVGRGASERCQWASPRPPGALPQGREVLIHVTGSQVQPCGIVLAHVLHPLVIICSQNVLAVPSGSDARKGSRQLGVGGVRLG